MVLPTLMICGGWMYRNKTIFNDLSAAPEAYASKSLTILEHFPQDVGPPKVRKVVEDIIDKHSSWSYFDGASQGGICGTWIILHINEDNVFNLWMNCGIGLNTKAELMALWCLLKFA